MKVQIDTIKEDVTEIKEMVKEHIASESDRFEKMDAKYAEKDTVKALEKRIEKAEIKDYNKVSWISKNAFNIVTVSIIVLFAAIELGIALFGN